MVVFQYSFGTRVNAFSLFLWLLVCKKLVVDQVPLACGRFWVQSIWPLACDQGLFGANCCNSILIWHQGLCVFLILVVACLEEFCACLWLSWASERFWVQPIWPLSCDHGLFGASCDSSNTSLAPGFMHFLYSCGYLSVTYQWFGKTTVGLWEILGPVYMTPFMWLRGFWSKYKLWCMFSDLIAHLCSSERSGVLIECGCVYFVFLVGAGEEAKYRWFCQGCSCQGSPNWGVSLFPQVWSKWWVNISVACTYLLTVEKFPT